MELDSMELFFAAPDLPEEKKSKPLIGSVKSNLGHMLTAAGMGGMTKVILALQYGKIPATRGVKDAMSSKNDGVSANQIILKTTAWPHRRSDRRAAVSAFGFGGTNAHLIFESGVTNAKLIDLPETQNTIVPSIEVQLDSMPIQQHPVGEPYLFFLGPVTFKQG